MRYSFTLLMICLQLLLTGVTSHAVICMSGESHLALEMRHRACDKSTAIICCDAENNGVTDEHRVASTNNCQDMRLPDRPPTATSRDLALHTDLLQSLLPALPTGEMLPTLEHLLHRPPALPFADSYLPDEPVHSTLHLARVRSVTLII